MMSLLTLQRYLQTPDGNTPRQIAEQAATPLPMVEAMLQLLERQGKIEPVPTRGCSKGCGSCGGCYADRWFRWKQAA